MVNIFNRITKGNEDQLFYEVGILDENGRLTQEGRNTFLDLIFIGKSPEEARRLIAIEAKKEKESKE
jgi:hypothetical protein